MSRAFKYTSVRAHDTHITKSLENHATTVLHSNVTNHEQ